MSMTIEQTCLRSMKLAGRGDKPSPDDYNEALTTLELILENWSVNHGVEIWDLSCQDLTFLAGDLVSNNNQVYLCKKANVSDSSNEPGIGSDYEKYWIESSLSTSNVWNSGISYVANRSLEIVDSQTYSISNLVLIDPSDNESIIPLNKVNVPQVLEVNPLEQSSQPTSYFIEQHALGFSVKLFPQPTQNYNLKVHLSRKPQNFDAGDSDSYLDVPGNWVIAVMYALAVELAYLYGLSREEIAGLISKANYEFKKCLGTDKSRSDSCFVKSTY